MGKRAATPDVPLTVQHIFNAGLGDDGIIAFEPLVLVLPDEAGVVATLQSPLVVNDCKQGVSDLGGKEWGETEQITQFYHHQKPTVQAIRGLHGDG